MNLNPCPSFEHQSVDMMFAEMEAADTQIGVIGVPGPTSDRGLAPTSADTIADIVVAHPDRFVGFGSVEPSDVESAVARLGELAAVGMRGVTIDPRPPNSAVALMTERSIPSSTKPSVLVWL